jgi:DNA polymerase-3 subunit gamma/tau
LENLPLHRKYRPQELDQFIGNDSLIESLKTVIERNITTILFRGPRGCGKTSLARIVAKKWGARENDIFEYNVAKQGGIAEARSIIETVRFIPFGGKAKVYILDEVQGGDPRARKGFQNALLKTLEEPPKKVYFILCTTEPEQLLPTVRSRCTQFQVSSLGLPDLTTLIEHVLDGEGRENFPEDAIREITFAADGCPRDALVTLDAVIDIEDDKALLKAVKDFSYEKTEIVALFNGLLKRSTKWKDLAKIIKGIDEDPEIIRYAVLTRMANILLSGKEHDRAALIIEEFKDTFIYSKKAGLVSACYGVHSL